MSRKPPAKKKQTTRAGVVAILGAPNAGKSTLLNRMVGQKISIVSPKAQTTRMRVLGVMTESQAFVRPSSAKRVTGAQNVRDEKTGTQIAFVDTPGIFAPTRRLDRAMVSAAWGALEGADAVMLLVDASLKQPDEKTDAIVKELRARGQLTILALNKVDKLPPAKLLPLTERLHSTGVFDEVFMISALTGDGVLDLKKYLMGKMPEGPWLFPEDQLSDLPSQLLAAEATREQLYKQLQQELPYAATVVPESWEAKKDGSAVIRQKIVIARESHKPIVLGAGGTRIKEIGKAARAEIEQMLGIKAHLFLEVTVDEKWQDRPEFYKMVGLEFGKE